MWFADTGLGLGWGLLGVWLLAVVCLVVVPPLRSWLPGPARWPTILGSGGASALVLGQAAVVDGVADAPGPGVLDQSVWGWFVAHRSPEATVIMKVVSTVGGTAAMAVLAVIGAGVLWRARRRAAAVVVVIAAVGAGLLVEGFKRLYGRDRPPVADRLSVENTFSLPSGHALGSMVVLGVLAAAVVVVTGRRAVRVGAVALGVAGIAVIATSRLYLGVHWATDVLTGWLLGGAWLAACATALTLIGSRSPSPRTPATVTEQ